MHVETGSSRRTGHAERDGTRAPRRAGRGDRPCGLRDAPAQSRARVGGLHGHDSAPARRPHAGRPTQCRHGAGSGGLLCPGIAPGLSARRRRNDPLRPPGAVGRRRQRRLRRGIPERLVAGGRPAQIQDRHRRVDRGPDGAIRLARTAVRRRTARFLYDHVVTRHLHRRLVSEPGHKGADRRSAARHQPAGRAHREACRCRRCCARSAKPTRAGSGSTSGPWTSIPSISSSGTWGSSPSADARNPSISFAR